jgi:hypothetical protein
LRSSAGEAAAISSRRQLRVPGGLVGEVGKIAIDGPVADQAQGAAAGGLAEQARAGAEQPAAARPDPSPALVALATTPPAPRPMCPSTLERLRRDRSVITTNYSCRIRRAAPISVLNELHEHYWRPAV